MRRETSLGAWSRTPWNRGYWNGGLKDDQFHKVETLTEAFQAEVVVAEAMTQEEKTQIVLG